MLQTAQGNFVIVNGTDPKLFWKGQELTEVIRILFHSDEEESSVKIWVQDTNNFDVAYGEMEAGGITIKKITN